MDDPTALLKEFGNASLTFTMSVSEKSQSSRAEWTGPARENGLGMSNVISVVVAMAGHCWWPGGAMAGGGVLVWKIHEVNKSNQLLGHVAGSDSCECLQDLHRNDNFP